MATVHFLNVNPGDCTIIRHNSGRVTMVDICDGNLDQLAKLQMLVVKATRPRGDFRMRDYPTNPIAYARSIGITQIFRFILTHPDMDHMDGLNALLDQIGIEVFWDTGLVRERPKFGDCCAYNEADWDRYEALRAGDEPGVVTLNNLAGARFPFANMSGDGSRGGDGLYILAPNKGLVETAANGGDINDSSYVLLYRSSGGRVLITGDADDATWEYVLEHHSDDVRDCAVMIAPHHGRDSGRCYDFLDHIQPKLTLFGNAPSEHMAYDAWNSRGLDFVTSNQAGNMVLETDSDSIRVYIENENFAVAKGMDADVRNEQGYVYLQTVQEKSAVSLAKALKALELLAGASNAAAGYGAARRA
jgi:competence protein ComEC